MMKTLSFGDIVAILLAVVSLLLIPIAALIGGCATTDAGVALYGAERTKCVEDNDAAPAARDCMRKVDERYGQDGGLR